MIKFKKQIVSAAAAGAMLLNVAMPALAGTEIVISGNGAGSDNWTDVTKSNTTTVTQNNNAIVSNNVNADAKTGGNDASFNTGGDVVVQTGDAKVKSNIENVLNVNNAKVDCCETGDTDVKISGNGAKSDNTVVLGQTTTTTLEQDNFAKVRNDVNADAKTGGNGAYKNVGGDVTIVTGAAKVDADISTVANVNSAKVASSHGAKNPSASFIISGNGAGSDNYIDAALNKLTTIEQDNLAFVTNDVDANAETGDNEAGFNTGGDVVILSGDPLHKGGATVNVDVDNAVNFNYADVDCGCTWDVLAKISGNGAEAGHNKKWWDKDENVITLELDSIQAVGQGNNAYLNNYLDELDAKTGGNEAGLNVGEADSDPAIITGSATVETGIENSGNVNSVGDFSFDLPEMPDFEFSFSFAAMMAFFGASLN